MVPLKKNLKLKLLIAAFITFVFCGSASAEPKSRPAAIVLSASGTVMIEYAGSSYRAEGTTVLDYGAEVVPESGASAIILFKNGKKETATKRFEINAENSKITGAATTKSNAATEILFGTFSGKGGNSDLPMAGGVSGGLRLLSADIPEEEPVLTINAYHNTAIMESRPTLSWTSNTAATNSVFVVTLIEIGGDSVFRNETASSSIPFPENASSLKWGAEYRLSVSLKDNPSVEAHADFSILSEQKANEVKQLVSEIEKEYSDGDALTARYMLLVELYINYGLYHDGISALGALRRVDGNCRSYCSRRTLDLYNLTKPKNDSDAMYDEIFK